MGGCRSLLNWHGMTQVINDWLWPFSKQTLNFLSFNTGESIQFLGMTKIFTAWVPPPPGKWEKTGLEKMNVQADRYFGAPTICIENLNSPDWSHIALKYFNIW